MELKTATRTKLTIKLGLQGLPASGKTYSALLLAFGLTGTWEEVAVIDTESQSSNLYAHLGAFNVLPLAAPFSPERYIEALRYCEQAGMKTVIIDSLSHEWSGQGGLLETHGRMPGNSFTNWNKITPRHSALIEAILQSPLHIITTIRSKQGYVLNERNGKVVPEKVGLKGVQREGLDYELTVVFELDKRYQATVTKDRTGIFQHKPPFRITPETGRKIKAWCLDTSPGKQRELPLINSPKFKIHTNNGTIRNAPASISKQK